ncbi:MAG: cupin domain-containing protein [Planctomycetota bacterium]
MKNSYFADIENRTVIMDGVKDVSVRMLISRADGAPNFSMRMFELQPGGHTLRHSHNYEHLVYIVEGEGELFFEGSTNKFEGGHAILVEPGKLHQFRNTGNTTLRFLCLIPNGNEVPDKMK